MNDPAIRTILRQTELSLFANDNNSKIVEELEIRAAKARIDVAVINGHFHGYEIKSAVDTLQRLPSQLTAYSKIFDYLSIVTEYSHHERILSMIPRWVGLLVCCDNEEQKQLEVIQPPAYNDNKDGFFIAKMLWREELIDVFSEHQVPFKKRYTTWKLCEVLRDTIEQSKLSHIVREKIKRRTAWKLKECCEVV